MSTTSDPRRGRRSPTADQLRAWRAFIETSKAVEQVIEAGLQTDSGLSSGDYAVMVALHDQPDRRLRSSVLADRISWERSRLSHHLGRMEGRGLVTRRAAEGDSRGAVVVLTDEGAHLFRRASAPHLHAIHDAFVVPLTAGQLQAVGEAMVALRAHLDQRPI